MKQTTTFRDAERISAYLDGQLSEAEARRLSARLESDPELASVAQALRQARGLLRQAPRRRAPRNFTLTSNMAGLKPPAPRAVPFMRMASAFAAALLFLTFAVNGLGALSAAAPMPYGFGGGGGGAEETVAEPSLMLDAVTEAPAAALPTLEPAETLRAFALPPEETAAPKAAPEEGEAPLSEFPRRATPVPGGWQIALALLAGLLGGGAFLLTRFNEARWRRKLPPQ